MKSELKITLFVWIASVFVYIFYLLSQYYLNISFDTTMYVSLVVFMITGMLVLQFYTYKTKNSGFFRLWLNSIDDFLSGKK